MTVTTSSKIIIVVLCFVFAVTGFLIKIPVPLRGNDKLLHSVFYFMAAAFLNLLFKRKHIVIFISLALFGVLIEYLQQLSNKITHSRIHGRFDIEDIYANIKGLLLYSLVALLIFACNRTYRYVRAH